MSHPRGPLAESLVRCGMVLGLVAGTAGAFLVARDLVRGSLERRAPVQSLAAPLPPATVPAAGQAVGCSASNCHGHAVPAGPDLRPDDTWRWAATLVVRDSDPDPHANAWHVLTEPASIEMMRRFNSNLPEEKRVAAESSARCLACHSHPAAAIAAEARSAGKPFDEEHFRRRTDGISCDTCHQDNARGEWRLEHVGWNDRTDREARYQSLELPFLNDLPVRGRLCAGCHVGAAEINGGAVRREVDHDLIAAGHPPLGFELLGSTRRLPKHWHERDCRVKAEDSQAAADRTMATWGSGQRAVLNASLDLMEKDGRETTVWPEFAQMRCFGCHDGMGKGGGSALRAGGTDGSSLWRRGVELQSLFDSPPAPVEEFLHEWSRLALKEDDVRRLIPEVRNALESHPASVDTLRKAIERLQQRNGGLERLTWDEAVWLRGALAALEISRRKGGGALDAEMERAFEELDVALVADVSQDPGFLGIVTPRRYDPRSTGAILAELIRKLQAVDPRLQSP